MDRDNKNFTVFHVLSIFILSFILYSDTLHLYFLSDDFGLVQPLKGSDVVNRFFSDWGGGKGGFYRPIIIVSFYVDSLLWKYNPLGFHLTNLLFHIFNSLLVYFIAALFFKNKTQAFIAAIFFVCHPVHADAVAWLSARTSLMCAFFVLLSLWAFLSWQEKQDKKAMLIASSLFFALALLSKEEALTFPILIAFYTLISTKDARKCIQWSCPFFIVLFLYVIVRFTFVPRIETYGATFSMGSLYAFILKVESLYYPFHSIYLKLFLGIKNSSLSPGFPMSFYRSAFLILFIALPILLWKHRTIRFLFLWIYIFLIPTFNALSNTYLGGWYAYIPSVGFCLLLAELMGKLEKSEKVRKKMLFSVLLLFIVATSFIMVSTRLSAWKRASNVTITILTQIKQLRPSVADGSSIHFFNLPDSFDGAYIFRNGFEVAVKNLYPKNKVNVQGYFYVDKSTIKKLLSKKKTYTFIFFHNRVYNVSKVVGSNLYLVGGKNAKQ